MPLEIGNYGVALKPVFLISALTGAFPASKGTRRAKFNFALMSALVYFLFYAIYRFCKHFLKAWKDHDKRETSLNLGNIMIMSTNCIAGCAAVYTCLCKSGRVHLILKGLHAQSMILRFKHSPEHRKLKIRVWVRAISAYVIMNILFVYEPFVWPDYFLLADLIGRLWSSVVIAMLEMQIVCVADAFEKLFRELNEQLANSDGKSVETLRKVHDQLCDLMQHFQDHFGIYILANVLYLFLSLTFGSYFSLVGIFQNLPDVEKIIKQAVVSNSWLVYASFRAIRLVASCSEAQREAKKTGVAIHRSCTPDVTNCARKELLMFSQQVQHRKYKFYATGVLLIDYTLLYEAFSSVATYFLIMVQFQNSL